ncbi:MAG: PIN domain-containing protein [Planctomycetales bacterium]
MNAIDANVYVYTLDADEPVKQRKAVELLDRLALTPVETVILWQVASEFLGQLRRFEAKGLLTAMAVEAGFQRFRATFALRIPTDDIFQASFDLRSRFSLSHWDSMLVAACQEAGITALYSEDMAAGMNYDGVAIVNPFA